jgi:hypothetical protein
MSPQYALLLSSQFVLIQVVTLLLLSLNAIATDTSPIVNLGYAQYQGYRNESSNMTIFLGMRYAAPPTGWLMQPIKNFPSMV